MGHPLADKQCIPCRGGMPPLKGGALEALAGQIDRSWGVVDEHHIEREFGFGDFRGALAFVNQVGELAELQGHHPEIYLTWGKVRVAIHTHSIDGLTESDFILAAKIDQIVLAAAS